jgi:hypothetical protein
VFGQRQQFTSTEAVWILVIALLTAVALFGGAFFFGTSLSADTVESVAPSPLGSSLTNVRESVPADYVERLFNASAAAKEASLAALARSRSDFYADQSNSARAAVAPAAAPAMTIRASHYARLGSLTAAEAASLGNIVPAPVTLAASHYARLGSLTAAEAASLGSIAPAAVPAMTIRASHYARLGSLTAAEAASLGNIVPAPMTLAASHYARLGNLTAAEAASLGNIAPAAVPSVSANLEKRRAPFYAGLDKGLRDQGIRPSAGSSSGMAGSSAATQWIKPEGIQPSTAVDSATTQSPWIKPEEIRAN